MRRRLSIAVCLFALVGSGIAVEDDAWLQWFSAELSVLDARRAEVRRGMDRLDAPVIGQTAPQFGHQSQRLSQPPLTPPWVQVDSANTTTSTTAMSI